MGQILSQAESIGLTVPFLGGDGWDGLEGYATADQLKDSYFCANYAKLIIIFCLANYLAAILICCNLSL